MYVLHFLEYIGTDYSGGRGFQFVYVVCILHVPYTMHHVHLYTEYPRTEQRKTTNHGPSCTSARMTRPVRLAFRPGGQVGCHLSQLGQPVSGLPVWLVLYMSSRSEPRALGSSAGEENDKEKEKEEGETALRVRVAC